MLAHRPLQLLLAARLYGANSEEICARGEALLDALAVAAPELALPVLWNFAAASLLQSPSRRLHNLIVEIKARRSARGDRVLPAGFAGAAHPALLDEELRRELTWCFKNPWFSALSAVFGESPSAVLPFRADPLREAVCGCYSAAGFRLLALPVAAGRPPLPAKRGPRRPLRRAALPSPADFAPLARLWGLGPGRTALLPALVLRSAAEAALLVRGAAPLGGPEARLLVLLDPRDPGDREDLREQLRRLLGGLAERHSLSFPPLEQVCAASPPAGAPALSALALAAESEAQGPGRGARAGRPRAGRLGELPTRRRHGGGRRGGRGAAASPPGGPRGGRGVQWGAAAGDQAWGASSPSRRAIGPVSRAGQLPGGTA